MIAKIPEAFVLFREHAQKGEVYFTGKRTQTGVFAESVYAEKARPFETAADAYRFAGRYPELKYWRVGRRYLLGRELSADDFLPGPTVADESEFDRIIKEL